MFNDEVMVPPVHPRDNDHNNDGDLLLEKVRHTIAFLLRRRSYSICSTSLLKHVGPEY